MSPVEICESEILFTTLSVGPGQNCAVVLPEHTHQHGAQRSGSSFGQI